MAHMTRIFIGSVLMLSLLSCHQEIRNGEAGFADIREGFKVKGGYYDSQFPDAPVSPYLTDFAESINLLSILAYYQSYNFAPGSDILKEDLSNTDLESSEVEEYVFQQSASGTAALVYHYNNRIAFLTCAHIVDFPDTVIDYYRDDQNNETDFVKSYIIKVRQANNVINQPIAYDFHILAIDKINDIALVGKEYRSRTEYRYEDERNKRTSPSLVVLNVPLGKANYLDFGTFVYLLGYPLGRKMVSTAIVSSPNYDNNSSFILDATLQRGISGGLVLAIRGGVPNFELVGIIKAISGKTEYSVVPDHPDDLTEWELHQPYNGKLYLEKQHLSEPGMTYVVGIETIMQFIDDNEEKLMEEGYIPEFFFR